MSLLSSIIFTTLDVFFYSYWYHGSEQAETLQQLKDEAP